MRWYARAWFSVTTCTLVVLPGCAGTVATPPRPAPVVYQTSGPRALLGELGGVLNVRLSEPPEPIAEGLVNRAAAPTARIQAVRLRVYVIAGEDLRDLTEPELSAVAFEGREIMMRGLGTPVRHVAPNGAYFTVRDLVAAVEETERATRAQSEWFGGVDTHHVFFQGLYLEDDGVWRISWGS